MPFCPKCGYEYQNHIDICPDCEVDLVPELPPEIPDDYKDADWVEVHTFPGTLYAQMAVEMLNRGEIPSYSVNRFGAACYDITGGADYVGAATSVFVLEPDLEQALSILEPMIEEIPETFSDDYSDENEE